jgi:hypothetical protein
VPPGFISIQAGPIFVNEDYEGATKNLTRSAARRYSRKVLPTTGNTLLNYLVRLAIEPEELFRFVSDPDRAATDAGLSEGDRRTLFSGDEGKVYAALASTARQ